MCIRDSVFATSASPSVSPEQKHVSYVTRFRHHYYSNYTTVCSVWRSVSYEKCLVCNIRVAISKLYLCGHHGTRSSYPVEYSNVISCPTGVLIIAALKIRTGTSSCIETKLTIIFNAFSLPFRHIMSCQLRYFIMIVSLITTLLTIAIVYYTNSLLANRRNLWETIKILAGGWVSGHVLSSYRHASCIVRRKAHLLVVRGNHTPF